MAGAEFGLSEAPALAVSAGNHATTVDEMFGDLRALIGEMEADATAQGGNALTQFRLAKADFVEAYNQLADKYGVSAMAQDATSTDGTTTDESNEGEYSGAHGALTPIKPISIQI
ncbi:hypothetical protein [Glycomyces buryatensis]|uniref:Uncharacterized protein n=1 Tax=Glycomyces buryatensis TaxID=2570927 RepID=A0A4S8QFP0_9ACTN|nr:hypothetical protein [Glycomyces buryatensis]THV40139.1 hypothetical protein FAB82_15690 [Glycomyces buryatensis]